MRIAAFIFVLAASVTLFAQVPPPPRPPPGPRPSPTPETPSKSIIRGKVIYQDTGKPVRRAPISLITAPEALGPNMSRDQGGKVYKTGLTNAEGDFIFTDVGAGTYLPQVDLQGVLTPKAYRRSVFFAGTSDTPERLYELFEPIKVDGLNEFPVVIRVKRSAAITGKIVYSDGDPATGLEVEALSKREYGFERNRGGEIGSVKTDDRGIYRFTGLPPGEYIVRVTELAEHVESAFHYDAGSQLKTYFPASFTASGAAEIKLDLGQERTGIDITLADRKLFTLSGSIVRKKDGSPIVGSQVYLEKIDDEGIVITEDARLGDSVADANGNWMFKNVPAGKYRLGTQQYDPGRRDGENDDKTEKLAVVSKEITIEGANQDKVVIEVPTQSTISGKLSFSGKEDVPNSVFIVAFDPKTRASAYTRALDESLEKGKRSNNRAVEFKLEGLAEGNYTFYLSPLETFYVKSIVLGSVDLMTTTLVLKEGEDVRDVQVTLSSDIAILKGLVLDGAKLPVRNAMVFLVPVDVRKQTLGTGMAIGSAGHNGEFEIRAAPGEYHIVAVDRTFRPPKKDESPQEAMRDLVKNAERVTLRAGDNAPVTVRPYVP